MVRSYRSFEAWRQAVQDAGHTWRVEAIREYPTLLDAYSPVVAYAIGDGGAAQAVGFWDQDERQGYVADSAGDWEVFEQTGEGLEEEEWESAMDAAQRIEEEGNNNESRDDFPGRVDAASDWARDEEALGEDLPF